MLKYADKALKIDEKYIKSYKLRGEARVEVILQILVRILTTYSTSFDPSYSINFYYSTSFDFVNQVCIRQVKLLRGKRLSKR